ncbi:MAG TPA: sn-glycerol-3-phosphate ABC transporter ATP-binding protein UgpC [Solirubrobacteraceae bacterium]
MASIELDAINKVYPNGFHAVHDLSLTVADGEFMVLVGPSGCGKTTALRMVAGLEEITSGSLRIGEESVATRPPRERDIAMVFQNYALYPHMTVRENIGFALSLKRTPKADSDKKIREAAQILGLTESLDRKPAQLSGGQRQRVAMGRAIVREPSAFLMDEPLSNLDAKLRVQMRAEVSQIHRRLGVATMYVTHDQTEAMTMGDRVAVLNAGVLQQCDHPQVLYDSPDNLFVAGFMGSPAMNLYEATLEGDLGALHLGSQSVPLPSGLGDARPGLRAFGQHKVIVGIRPEELTLAAEPDGAGGMVVDVELVEALGSELLVHYTLDAHRVHAHEDTDEQELAEMVGGGIARVPARTPVTVGDRIRLRLSGDGLHFFDPASGEAIR